MKKNLGKILSLALVLAFLLTPMRSYAEEPSSPVLEGETVADSLYVLSENCSEEILNEGINLSSRLVLSEVEQGNLILTSDVDVEVGQPFIFEGDGVNSIKLYNFPIFIDQNIEYIVRVYLDPVTETYEGIISQDLTLGLESLKNKTSKDLPAKILVENGAIYSIIGDEKIKLLSNSDPNFKETAVKNRMVQTDGIENQEIINISENKEKINIPQSMNRALASNYFLSLDMKERQGSLPRCTCYTSAAVVRYVTGKSYVTQQTAYNYYGTNSNNGNVARFMNAYGAYYTSVSGTLHSTTIKTNIYNNKPIVIAAYGYGDRAGASHSLVIRGYSDSSWTYSVWNPWYNYYESMSYNSKTYVTSNAGGYIWDNTVAYYY